MKVLVKRGGGDFQLGSEFTCRRSRRLAVVPSLTSQLEHLTLTGREPVQWECARARLIRNLRNSDEIDLCAFPITYLIERGLNCRSVVVGKQRSMLDAVSDVHRRGVNESS